MPDKKKRSQKKMKKPPVHQPMPTRVPGAGEAKRTSIHPGLFIGIVALLILFALIVIFTMREKKQTLPSDQSKTATRRESEEKTATSIGADNTDSQYGIEMVYVRGGAFMTGCTTEQGSDCYDYEEQAHQTTVSDFYIGKYEVTQAQWKAVMGNDPSHFKGDDLPVENVSWDDAQEFIKKLNAATGKAYRLPTGAEWEYAARGGGQSRGDKYSGSANVGDVAWYEGNSENKTHPVGTKKANELGIHDMSGNVWEWVSDLYGNNGNTPQSAPGSPDGGSFRVIRGGGWGSYARGVRVSNYYNNGSGNRYNILGFRLAMS